LEKGKKWKQYVGPYGGAAMPDVEIRREKTQNVKEERTISKVFRK